MIDSLRAERGEPCLLDGGDFLGNGSIQGNRDRADLVMEAMARMGYRVATLGEVEFGYGWPFVQELAQKHGLEFVCANAFDAKTGKPLMPSYVIRQVGEYRVAVFGMLSPDLAIAPLTADPPPEIRDPLEIGAELVPRLRQQADYVVGLLHMSMPKAKQFTQQVGGLDMVVFSHDPALRPKLELVEDTQVPSLRPGTRGQRVGIVDLAPNDSTGRVEFTGAVVPLDGTVPEQAAMGALVTARDAEINSRIGLENARRTAERVLEKGEARFLGDVTCQRCHTDVQEHWAQTAHAHAFATLEKDDHQKDASCLACHTTGYGTPSGYAEPTSSPDMRNVQCEACHGQGSAHGPGYAAAAWKSCAACHTKDMSPGFKERPAWREIEHPRRELTRQNGAARG